MGSNNTKEKTKENTIEETKNFLYIQKSDTSLDFWEYPIIFNNENDKILINNNNYIMLDEITKFNVSNIIVLSRGSEFCVLVCTNGVFSWGSNESGQLGIGTKTRQFSSQLISFFKTPEEILSLSCGSAFSICICKNGVFSWGDNKCGQLGIGNFVDQSSPQQILFFKNAEEIISLSCGSHFSICICKNGVFSWGGNGVGQLGIGNFDNQSSPQQISFFQNPKEIISLSCGSSHCICLCKNGVFSWGYNGNGQLGNGLYFNRYFSPQQISFFQNPEEIISLSCGSEFSICICKNGIFSWGSNFHGQLGIGNFKPRSSPQQIEFFKNPEDIISLHCGYSHCSCICKNGIFGWGNNQYDQLAVGNNDDQPSPRPILFTKEIGSFSDLSFPQNSIIPSIVLQHKQKLLLILAREYLDPEEYLMGKDYLPWDLFNLLLKLI